MNSATTKDKIGLPGILVMLALVALLVAECWAGFRVYQLSREREQIKIDYSVSNNITFGVFSVDMWREKITGIVEDKIGDFKVTAQQKKALQKKIEVQLNGLVTKVVKDIKKPQKSIGGKLKKFAFKTFVDEDELRQPIPEFARTIVNKVSSPASMKRLKYVAGSKIDSLESQTFDNSEPASVTVNRNVYKKYKVNNAVQFDQTIERKLDTIKRMTMQYALVMAGAVILALGLWWLVRMQPRLYTPAFIVSILFALVILIVGTSATIIEVDARIESLKFTLLGEKLSFDNQVLFFQSKSIFAVVMDLLKEPKPDAVLVGVLLFLFVLVLPLLRLIGKGMYVCYRERNPEDRVAKFLAFDLDKWDMADVMIVGVGMTYIGLNGILKSQLSGLNIQEDILSTTTSNATSLQAGYFIFTGFVVYSIVLTLICKRIKKTVPL
ncbi:2-methylisocitrate lyase [Pedobacter sp. BAL39]|uniref:paraquat-inducible protein A n=1 Tax=Pedobacter sp. BAL39 TaxID=391596 RepID=UPI0001559689|nr:paraquat-inducible protein A [Pedobacter sp. BAL39]EDM34966.1 2-methylisocitrate lyase [Pedobacter sp. BAL39]